VTQRRHLLQLAAAAATTLWLPRSAWSQWVARGDPFTLGVASGSPQSASVVLWTRLVHDGLGRDPLTVRWEVAQDAGFVRIVQSGQAQALPALAYSVHVEVNELAPDSVYFYRFMAGGAVSPTGRTRTLPAADADLQRLRLAYASCQRWEHGYYAAWRHMRDDNPDFVVFLGDYIYEYPSAARAVRAGAGYWTLTLDDYRARYALHKSDGDLQAIHAACPWFVTWDDHEVQNDYAGTTAGDSGPVAPSFTARRAAAYQAFYEHMPLRASVLVRAFEGLATGAEMRLYGQARFGRLAALNLLDARQYKDAPVCTRGFGGSSTVDPANCAAWDDPRRSLLGAAQEAWLADALADAGTQWNVIGQQSLFGARDFRPGPGRSLWNDGWDGYTAARARVSAMLARPGVANPVLLGGDVHENWVGHVKSDYANPDSAAIGVEFCGTSITSRTNGDSGKLPERLAENPHFVFADMQRRGYGLADFTAQQLQVRLRTVDDVTRADSGISTLASFSVAAGRPVVERL